MFLAIQKYLIKSLTQTLEIPILSSPINTFPYGYISNLTLDHADNDYYEFSLLLYIMSNQSSNAECLTLVTKLFSDQQHIHNHYRWSLVTHPKGQLAFSPLMIHEWRLSQEDGIWQGKMLIKGYFKK